jgi:hypothetical protein
MNILGVADRLILFNRGSLEMSLSRILQSNWFVHDATKIDFTGDVQFAGTMIVPSEPSETNIVMDVVHGPRPGSEIHNYHRAGDCRND